MTPPPVGVIGLGLIGGSLARRLAAQGSPVVGWDADAGTRADAEAAGLAVAPSVAGLAAAGGIVFVAVPLPEIAGVLAAVAVAAPAGTLLSDVTSVKAPVRALARSYDLTYVGGHPMAGTADSGFAASSPDLLAGAPWVLTLDPETPLAAWLAVAELVTGLGCHVVPCSSTAHDEAVAKVSHLPHVLATALVLAAAQDPLAMSLAAGSYRDATRVAATRPELVAAMCGGNADAIEPELLAIAARLAAVTLLLSRPAELSEWFRSAQAVRRSWPVTPSAQIWLPVDDGLRRALLALGAAGGQVIEVRQDEGLVLTRALN